MKTSQVIKAVCNQLSMEPNQVLFKNNGRQSRWEVTRTRHLLKYILYHDIKMSTPRISRLCGRVSTGFDHATTLHSLKVVDTQRYLFGRDLEEIRKRLNFLRKQECLKKTMN